MLKISHLFFLFFFAGCAMFGLDKTPEPEYTIFLEEKSKGLLFEVRDYSELVILETTVNDEDFNKVGRVGFDRLGGYIFGENKNKEKIQMTAPVFLDENSKEKSWKIIFILPKKYTLDKAPPPTNQKVIIKKMTEKRFAVVQFNGFLSKENFDEHTEKLKAWIKLKNFQSVSDPIFAGYNPPWTLPFWRRNEVFIEINK